MRRDRFVLFLALWITNGLLIDELDLRGYALQPSVIDAIVTRGTFALAEGPNRAPPVLDSFWFGDRLLPAKQPGLFVWGVPPYWVLHSLGLSFATHYVLATAVVAFFTGALFSALGAVALHALVEVWGYSRPVRLLTTLCYALGTTLFPFSGAIHQDAMASSLLMAALYLIERNRCTKDWASGRDAFASGLLLGLTLFTSMLPGPVVPWVLLHVAAGRRRRAAAATLAGLAAGLLPLCAYNLHYFGNPLLQAYAAGNWDIYLERARPWQLLNAYLGSGWLSVLKYQPIAVVGLLALPWLAPAARRIRAPVLTATIAQIAYLVNIPTYGHCQYGPRYLLAIVPLLVLGLPAAWERARRSAALACGLFLLAGYSFVVNLIGAWGGSNYCDVRARFGAAAYLGALDAGVAAFRVGLVVVVLLSLALGWLALRPTSEWWLGGRRPSRALVALWLATVGCFGLEAIGRGALAEAARCELCSWEVTGVLPTLESDGDGWAPRQEINADGLRDRFHAVEKIAGLRRIAFLGNRLTGGDSVHLQRSYPRLLQERVDAEAVASEVFVAALDGWSVRQARLAYARILRRYSLDLVVLALTLDDVVELQNNLAGHCALETRFALARALLRDCQRGLAGADAILDRPDAGPAQEGFARLLGEISRLRATLDAERTELAVLILPSRRELVAVGRGTWDSVVTLCARERISVLDAQTVLSGLVAPFGADGLLSREAGTAIADAIETRGWVSRPPQADRRGGAPASSIERLGKSREPRARFDAARALGTRPGSAAALDALYSALADPSQPVRWRAAVSLAGLDLDEPDRLTRALSLSDPYVRAFASWRLGSLGQRATAAVPALVGALRTDARFTRDGPANALLRIPAALERSDVSAAIVARGVRSLGSGSDAVKVRVARTLAQLGPRAAAAAPALVDVLHDSGRLARQEAVRSLAAMGPAARNVAGALARYADDPELWPDVRQALEAINGGAAAR